MHKMFVGYTYLFCAKTVIQAIDDVKRAYPDNFEISFLWHDLLIDTKEITDMCLKMNGVSFIELAVESRIRQLIQSRF